MSTRRMGFDKATLGDKVVEETDEYLVMPAVIAREIVRDYPEGKAYKPAEELEKTAWTAEGRWVAVIKHPDTGLITRAGDIKGRVGSASFVKDILDPKTKRPMVRGIRADIKWFKDKLPSGLLDEIKSGAMRDVSIGFTYEHDATPGEWEGQRYDFVQRNIFIDHVVAPCPVGRCPSPYCGIGVDALTESSRIAAEDTGDCPICGEIKRLGVKEAGKRLGAVFGPAAVEALKDKPIEKLDDSPKPEKPAETPVDKPAEKPADKQVDKPAEKPADQPSVEALVARTEEVLGIWKRLNQKSVRF